MTAPIFVRVGPEDLYEGFDHVHPPSLDDHWVEGTKMFTPEARKSHAAWNADVDRWSVARALHSAHRAPGVPRRYREAYEMVKAAHEWVLAMVAGDEPNVLVLYGEVGTGKTHSAIAAACLIHALTAYEDRFQVPGPSVQFALTGTLLRDLKNFGDAEARGQAIWNATQAKTLILDDLTRPKTSDFDHEALTEILDERLGRVPTIVTSNASSEDELDAAYGDHLASRLVGGSTTIYVFGPDRRRS